MKRKGLTVLALLSALSPLNGLLFPCPPKFVFKKKLALKKKLAVTAGATAVGGAVVGGAALAYLIQQQQQDENFLFTPQAGSLEGQTIFITGGTGSSLGLETAKRLTAGNPAQIIITARTAAKGDIALADIRTYMKESNPDSLTTLSYKILDLDSIQGIREAVASWEDNLPTINCLVNNAGIMALPNRELTEDGIERQMQTNHLGHFCLTALLAPKLADDARIVSVSSEAHKIAQMSGGLDLEYAWTGTPGYGAWKSYGQSKLANILFSQELQRRSDQAGYNWKVSCLHPGAVNTDLWRNTLGTDNWQRIKDSDIGSLVSAISVPFLKSPAEGASTSIYLAAGANSPDDPRARYYVDCKPVTLNEFARDGTAAKRLWEESELKSGVTFPFLEPTKDVVSSEGMEPEVQSEDKGSVVDEDEQDETEVVSENMDEESKSAEQQEEESTANETSLEAGKPENPTEEDKSDKPTDKEE
eukprot:scaffold162_cov176-Amphora_coffeaeformis.AAC.41